MINIISLLGSNDSQNDLSKRYEKEGIRFLCPDCGSGVVLLSALEEHPETDVIVLGNSQLRNQNIESILSDIRAVSPYVRIIVILSGNRNQYVSAQLSLYLDKYMVSDIIFEGSGIDMDALAGVMKKGRISEDEIHVDSKVVTESVQLKKYTSWDNHMTAEDITPDDEAPCFTIGVFGTTRGAGVTSMVTTLAEFFALHDKVVKAVDLTGTASLAFAKGKATYLSGTRRDMKDIAEGCDFVVYDFGTPYYISPKGEFMGLTQDYPPDIVLALRQCHFKVVMCFLDDWHVKKAEYFWRDEHWKSIIKNDYLFLFNENPDKLRPLYGHINMLDRNDNELSEVITTLFL